MEMAMIVSVVSLILSAVMGLLWHSYNVLVANPRRIRSTLERQGISGPSPSLLLGNIPDIRSIKAPPPEQTSVHGEIPIISHDWVATTYPHIPQWMNEYGPIFMYSVGSLQKLCVTDPEMVKEMSIYAGLDLGKPTFLSKERGALLGHGIVTSNGQNWFNQRKIIAPQFYMDKVKGKVGLMVDSTTPMLRSWGAQIARAGGVADIRVDEDLKCLSADIISRASFGSSYAKGQQIFSQLKNLQILVSQGTYGIPGLRHVPTKHNRETWKLEREIHDSILKLVEERRRGGAFENDFLQVVLDAAEAHAGREKQAFGIGPSQFVVDNCKSIYLAGHETASVTASWCLMLLATHPHWQARARAEVLEICRGSPPNADMLQSMKLLTMVVRETLRLYPPTSFIAREAFEDMTMKGLRIPKGLLFWTPIAILHQNREIWGPDAHLFKPERFEDGIMRACRIPQAYMPFGWGPRVCPGRHFASMELKAILSQILSNFQFTLSPMYRHSPENQLVVVPQHGVHLRVRRVDD